MNLASTVGVTCVAIIVRRVLTAKDASGDGSNFDDRSEPGVGKVGRERLVVGRFWFVAKAKSSLTGRVNLQLGNDGTIENDVMDSPCCGTLNFDFDGDFNAIVVPLDLQFCLTSRGPVSVKSRCKLKLTLRHVVTCVGGRAFELTFSALGVTRQQPLGFQEFECERRAFQVPHV